ncbi:MAG: YggT family protein [Rhodobacteraceae bacterium]|nr:YggT family protein [Paracoccaceae bacterium]
MTAFISIFDFALNIISWVVIIHVLMSWLISMQVLNPSHEFVRVIWDSLDRILEPIYSKIREILPPIGMIDLSPIVLIFGLYLLRYLVVSL